MIIYRLHGRIGVTSNRTMPGNCQERWWVERAGAKTVIGLPDRQSLYTYLLSKLPVSSQPIRGVNSSPVDRLLGIIFWPSTSRCTFCEGAGARDIRQPGHSVRRVPMFHECHTPVACSDWLKDSHCRMATLTLPEIRQSGRKCGSTAGSSPLLTTFSGR